ncbi:DUF6452 family protein [Psychroserpens ponticola]|uniref:DUF6452 family protein n=1 Tax=Psychroserpens ponticola TaxID=2932268 RepID=A0ABY7S0V1_9FLAO|nr:DUF6452 family protein [Psychroserpens ponticola]WCO03008.1 DUF6452 family protein [Psychroserpens ponticola]
MKLNIIKKISLAVILLLTVCTCERDDICPEDVPTTPRLLLKFFDISNQETTKNVPKLFIQGIDNDEPLSDYIGGTTSVSAVELPLKTNENSTQFRFIKNYAINDNGTPDDEDDDFETGNVDIITINYITETVYVSRACGYKTIFKAVNILLDEDDTNRWIVLAQALNDNQSIEDETTTHFNFFH